jgi:hypothetical protein
VLVAAAALGEAAALAVAVLAVVEAASSLLPS